MGLRTPTSRLRRWRPRTVIVAALVAGLLGLVATGLVSAVRKARDAAHSANTS
jgi:type II secretory pathway pseudopilin PulG